jgi:hypothetical protein
MRSTRIEMDEKTAAALRARGGKLYVWLDGAGLPRAGTTPPLRAMEFATISGDGWSVHVDSAIPPNPKWFIKWSRFPWPHFTPWYNVRERRPGGGVGVLDVLFGWLDR